MKHSAESQKNIRALHVIPDSPVGSYNIFSRREAASLASVGVDVETFYLSSRTSAKELVRLRSEFQEKIANFLPDVVHAHFGTMTALFCWLFADVPLVITFRGTDLNPDPSISRIRGLMGRTFSRIAAAGAARNICVTEELKRRLWLGKYKTVVMPGSVNPELFRPIPREEARAILGWNLDAPVVLFNAGRFPKIKRPDLATAAVQQAKYSVPDIQLFMLDGDVDPDRMPIIYSAADCLVVTSDHEGSPTVVREAMACNLPIVSVNVGDVAERIRNDVHSQVVGRDPQAIGAAIASTLVRGQRSNGREAVMEISEDRVARQLRELYEGVLTINPQNVVRAKSTAIASTVRRNGV
jgi:teichuronic acid biosynthesis glycosyltransferase TuaC